METCAVHDPVGIAWTVEHVEPDTEHGHGYTVLTTKCWRCKRYLVVSVAHAALQLGDEAIVPVLGVPEDG